MSGLNVADLLTHGLIAALARGPRHPDATLLWLVSGVIFPDLLSRAPLLAVRELQGHGLMTWVPLSSDRLLIGMNAPHTPVGIALVALLVAMLLPQWFVSPQSRLRVASLIGAGGALHLAVDVVQRHLEPGYFILYPFSVERWELGWFRSDGSVLSLPVLALLWLGLNWRWLSKLRLARGRDPVTPPWEE